MARSGIHVRQQTHDCRRCGGYRTSAPATESGTHPQLLQPCDISTTNFSPTIISAWQQPRRIRLHESLRSVTSRHKISTLKGQLWFLIFLGAEIVEVNDVIVQHKKRKAQLNAMASPIKSMTYCNSRMSDLGTPPVGVTSIGYVQSGLSIGDPAIDHARALNNDGAVRTLNRTHVP